MEQCVSGLMQAEMRKAVVYRVDISLDPIQVIDKAQCWLWQLLLEYVTNGRAWRRRKT